MKHPLDDFYFCLHGKVKSGINCPDCIEALYDGGTLKRPNPDGMPEPTYSRIDLAADIAWEKSKY